MFTLPPHRPATPPRCRAPIRHLESPLAIVAQLLLVICCCAVAATPVDAADDATDNEPYAILLDNGEVLWGRLTRVPQAYRLQLATGSTITLPRNRIVHVAADLEGLYDHRRQQTARAATATSHLELAAWCLAQQLWDHADNHLQAADRLAPNAPEVDQLRRRCETGRNNTAAPAESSAAMSAVIALETDSVKESGKLNVASAPDSPQLEEFTRRIQPVLLRGCAAAHCHGFAADNRPYRLIRPPRGHRPDRAVTLANLQQTIAQLGTTPEQARRFLNITFAAHGALQQPVWHDEDVETEMVRRWVADVLGSPAKSQPSDTLSADDNTTTRNPVAADHPSSTETHSADSPTPQPTDLFDPAVFNARYHTKPPYPPLVERSEGE